MSLLNSCTRATPRSALSFVTSSLLTIVLPCLKSPLSAHVSGSASRKSQPICRRLRRSRVFGVTTSSKLYCEAWLAVKVIRLEPGDEERLLGQQCIHHCSQMAHQNRRRRDPLNILIDTTGDA